MTVQNPIAMNTAICFIKFCSNFCIDNHFLHTQISDALFCAFPIYHLFCNCLQNHHTRILPFHNAHFPYGFESVFAIKLPFTNITLKLFLDDICKLIIFFLLISSILFFSIISKVIKLMWEKGIFINNNKMTIQERSS